MPEDGNASTLYINHANIFKTNFFILTEETKNFTLRNHQKVIYTVENGRQEWETWEKGNPLSLDSLLCQGPPLFLGNSRKKT